MVGWDRRVTLEKDDYNWKDDVEGEKDVIYEDKRGDKIPSRGYSNTNIVRGK